MNLADLTTSFIAALDAALVWEVGDARAPFDGEPVTADYPYLVVYDVSDTAVPDLAGGVPGHGQVMWQVTSVGLTREQATKLRDRARAVALNPATTVASSDARLDHRWQESSAIDASDGGGVWSASFRVRGVAVTVESEFFEVINSSGDRALINDNGDFALIQGV